MSTHLNRTGSLREEYNNVTFSLLATSHRDVKHPRLWSPLSRLKKKKESRKTSRSTPPYVEVRLAQTLREVRQAQRLRYRIFYKEMSATPTLSMSLLQRDQDAYDPICDHLVAIHHLPPNPFARRRSHGRIIGTYRLLLQEAAERHGGFYTQQEFDLVPLLQRHKGLRFLELGRSCVSKNYRDTRTLDLMWRGIVRYVCDHQVDVLIGCASFEGTDPKALALPLSFLYHNARASGEWGIHPHPDRYIPMNLLAPEEIDEKKAVRALPPLIRGYWRLGGVFGDGAVIDHQFGTTDVLVIVTRDILIKRYGRHFPALNNTHITPSKNLEALLGEEAHIF